MEFLKISEVEKLLLDNGFTRKDYSEFNNSKLVEDYEVIWGHSEIRTYERGEDLINVQYQDDEVWSFIFERLPLGFQSNTVSSTQSLNTYDVFKTIEDVVKLCKFANNIDIIK